MKVSLEKDYRRYYTLEDLDAAKAVIASAKEDDSKIDAIAWDVAAAFVGKYGDYVAKVLEVKAETGINKRIQYDSFCEGSGWFDVCFRATVETGRGFLRVVFFLSDYWYMDSLEYIQARAYHEYYTPHNGG